MNWDEISEMAGLQCINPNSDYEGTQIYSNKVVTARKAHKCFECGLEIPPGTKYDYAKGLWDGRWYSFKTCLVCVELWNHFYKNGSRVHGALMDELQEFFEWEPIPAARLEGLSEEALKIVMKFWNGVEENGQMAGRKQDDDSKQESPRGDC